MNEAESGPPSGNTLAGRWRRTPVQHMTLKRIVIKVGSSTLTKGEGELDRAYIASFAAQIAAQLKMGRSVILVTSGAIPVGRERLGLKTRPHTIPQKQAAAAIGQGLLMQAYAQEFDRHAIAVAQILLTRDDLSDRARYVNASNTIKTLLSFGAVPIVNENDTVAVDEIRFGDNDTLAARVASMAQADILVLLSDVAGLYDRNPAQFSDAKLIAVVKTIDKSIERLAGGSGSSVGTGGMRTKIDAAKICVQAGFPMVIADGSAKDVVARAIAGGLGTKFLPGVDRPLTSRKRWLAFGGEPKGALTVNEGAYAHITTSGTSLLAAGITNVDGEFAEGDVVNIGLQSGSVFAQGKVNFDSATVIGIMGKRTDEIVLITGRTGHCEVVHRDNLVLITQ